jgi:mono/diheme cytochrome c family protein
MKYLKITLTLLLVLVLGGGLFIWSGVYNPGADSPHWKITYAILQSVRDRAVANHASGIALPDNLDDPKLILKGAGHYADMCTGCHLAPGKKNAEIRSGLYPQPPNLSKARIDQREAFWVIKHGLKMTAMPAWGKSHDDATIWSIVAFVHKLPDMTPAQYKEIVAKAPPDEDMEHSHKH